MLYNWQSLKFRYHRLGVKATSLSYQVGLVSVLSVLCPSDKSLSNPHTTYNGEITSVKPNDQIVIFLSKVSLQAK